jgi:SAM-dependent methyltransferase
VSASFPPLAPLAWQRWGVVAPYLEELAPRQVLEIGCGLGGFGARLAARCDYVGVDQDETSLRSARESIVPFGGRVLQGTVDDVALSGFDLVCAFEVIEHIEDDLAALESWKEKVRPGGSVLVSAPAGPERYGPWDESVGHFRRYRAEDLETLFRTAGLGEVRHVYYGWPLGYLTEMVRNLIARHGRGDVGSTTIAARTTSSGRRLQPDKVTGQAARILTAPFVYAQRFRPDLGVGVVVCASRPDASG